ncbi:hypothetical protein SSX86_024827 [Deinandra increscens subsp. villosa]|uniref:Phospho-2-dehydro-3-deoxyheptonate aldolase n=1 Tax=Deinandra increscens subsp. villosa TaxID=3103831 RepID=A0AAP0CI32_9ASTR
MALQNTNSFIQIQSLSPPPKSFRATTTTITSFRLISAVHSPDPVVSKPPPSPATSATVSTPTPKFTTSTLKWTVESWKSKKAVQLPKYPDQNVLVSVLQTLEVFPPIVFAGEAQKLEEQLGEAAMGNAFLLQGGDCAESFKEFNANYIRDTFRVILKMGVMLMYVGRMASQFAKPRSDHFEEKDGVKLPSYRGDNVNATLNLLRAFATGGYAAMQRVNQWNLDFTENSEQVDRYHELASQVDEALGFMAAARLTIDHPIMTTTDFWTSHECLHLPYEQSLTRLDSTLGLYYDCSAHFVWVGERTRQLDGAHVEFLRGIANPLGIKVSDKMDPNELNKLIDILYLENKPGRITIITRMGAENMRVKFPHLIRAVRRAGQIVTWVTDPMHGNTIKAPSGLKTRPFDAIRVRAFFDVHEQEGSHPGGVHLEMTGQNVTECIGGSRTVTFDDLGSRYHTHCDPRLNASQSLELAFIIVERLHLIGILKENTALIPFKTKNGKEYVKVTVKLQDLNFLETLESPLTPSYSRASSGIKYNLEDDFVNVTVLYHTAEVEGLEQFGKFNVFEGRHSVSNAYDGTNLFINSDDIKEIGSFLQSFLETLESPLTPSYSRASSGIKYNLEDDFVNVTVLYHTAEVEGLEQVIVVGTIKMVQKNWFYWACNHCSKIVEVIEEALPSCEVQPLAITDGGPVVLTQDQTLSINQSESQPITQSQPVANTKGQIIPTSEVQVRIPNEPVTYICNTDDCKKKKKVIKPYPRFKLLLKVQDSSGTVDLTLFDGDAKKIIHKTALEVLNKFQSEKRGPSINIPTEVEALLERRYAFKIDVSDFNIKKRYKYYTIVKMTDDRNIMKALDDKHNIDQHYLTESLTSSPKELSSNRFAYQKDVISVTDDNETPLSVNTVEKRGDKHVSELKRNLDEVYDQVIPLTSPAKTTPPSVKSGSISSFNSEIGVNGKLLIPKVEK